MLEMSQKTPRRRSSKDPVFEGIRRIFDDIAREPLPPEFIELLRKIDARAADEPASSDPSRPIRKERA